MKKLTWQLFTKQNWKNIRYLPYLISALSVLIFIVLGSYYAHHIIVAMDEGTYLLKGQWFLQGTYRPFQAYGPVTNKMPFSFWIPGLSQVLFSPGIRSGRYFCIFLGVLMMVGLWLAVRRVSTPWWAAFAVACIALNPNWIQYYIRPFSQVITSLFVTWSLFFVLGRDRKLWQLIVGSILGCLTVLTRQNMLPYFGLLVLYLLWEHGWRKGLWASAVGGLVFVAIHIIYWPGIYAAIWQPLLPNWIDGLFGFASSKIGSVSSQAAVQFGIVPKLMVLGGSIRYSFIPIFATIVVLMAYPFRKLVRHPSFKPVVFLLASYLVLSAVHVLFGTDVSTVLYSVPAYFAFFNPIGLVLLPLAFPYLNRSIRPVIAGLSATGILLIGGLIGMNTYREISPLLLGFQIPRVKNLRIYPGTTELWRSLYNKFHLAYFDQEYILPGLAGLVICTLFIFLVLAVWKVSHSAHRSYGWILLLAFFIAGSVLTPTPVLSAQGATEFCAQDVIQATETVGAELRSSIATGSLVYWETGLSPILLSYIPDVRTFPPQLNNKFYYRSGGDPDKVYRANAWNEALAFRWIGQSDDVILGEESAKNWEPILYSTFAGQFDQLEPTSNTFPCKDRSFLRIYQRTK